MLTIIIIIMSVLTIITCYITSTIKEGTKLIKNDIGKLKASVAYFKLYTLPHLPILYTGDKAAKELSDLRRKEDTPK